MKPLLFIYQPKTIAIAIAFPVDVLVLISVITLVPPTTTLDAVIIPTLKFAGGEILVVNPARLDALDILFYFLVIYKAATRLHCKSSSFQVYCSPSVG